MNDNIINDIFLQKVADITDVPVEYVQKMRDKGMLDQQRIYELLIRHDYHRLRCGGKLRSPQVIGKLIDFYQVNANKVYRALHVNTDRIYFCKCCGVQLSKGTYKQNGGMCNKCLANSVNF